MSRKIKRFQKNIGICAGATAVGELESNGPLKAYFDLSSRDSTFGMETWEKAEAEMVRECSELAIKKAGLKYDQIDLTFSGDLTNQCTSSAFGLKNKRIPHIGLYGACSTFALSLGMSATAVEAGLAEIVLAEASSHFCSAERQYRFPLEYGCQRPPSAQNTVTGSGSVIVGLNQEKVPKIREFLPGIIRDPGVCDANKMGAAMAASCADTVIRYFDESATGPEKFDFILTGDLGSEGHSIFLELCEKEGLILKNNSVDCGVLVYGKSQNLNCGGSGCGCSAVVFASYVLEMFRIGKFSL